MRVIERKMPWGWARLVMWNGAVGIADEVLFELSRMSLTMRVEPQESELDALRRATMPQWNLHLVNA